MTNLSRPVKFEPGTLVKYIDGYSRAFEVDHNSGVNTCWLKARNTVPFPVLEGEVRGLTWWEFAYHIDPMSARRMVGKNPAWPLWYGLVFGSLCSWGSFHLGASSKVWEYTGSLPLAMLITWYLIGTIRNGKGKQA